MAKQKISKSRIYDRSRPEGKQDVAFLVSCISDDGEPQILFSGQQYEGGWIFLNKQHAVEFASCMLMMALQLPGTIQEGVCDMSDRDEDADPEAAREEEGA